MSPTKTKKACRHVGCGEASYDSYCSKHSNENFKYFGERKHAPSKIYTTERWARLRKMILAQQPICIVSGCNSPASHVDHIIGINEGGPSFDINNLQGMCHSCHSRKTLREGRRREQK